MSYETLKRRVEFLYVRQGCKWITQSVVLQARKRGPSQKTKETTTCEPENAIPAPRFGFTASKKVGNAVKRNRARRRLKAAVRHLGLHRGKKHSRPGYDYVLIARQSTLKRGFQDLLNDIRIAFKQVHRKNRNQGKHGH